MSKQLNILTLNIINFMNKSKEILSRIYRAKTIRTHIILNTQSVNCTDKNQQNVKTRLSSTNSLVRIDYERGLLHRKYSYIVLLIITCCLSGCNESVINRGYDVSTVDFNQIKPGKDTIEDVFNTFGSPTVRSSVIHQNGDYCWYYSSKNMTKLGFFKPTIHDRQLWIVTFDKNHIVKSVKLSNSENPVHMIHETSKSGGKTKGVIKETFGGIGKNLQKFDKS